MVDIKPTSLMIVMSIFIISLFTAASWISGINNAYPSANLSTEWNNSYYKLENLTTTGGTIREGFSSGEAGVVTYGDEGFLKGTLEGLRNVFATLALIPSMITDAIDLVNLPIPKWVLPFILLIITMGVLFAAARAVMKSGSGL